MLGLVTCAPSDTSQSVILAGDSTKGAEVAPMLENFGFARRFSCGARHFSEHVDSRHGPDIRGKLAPISAPESELPRPRISIVSEFIVLS